MQNKRNVYTFIIITFVLTFVLNFILYKSGGYEAALARTLLPLQMLIPALVAFLLIWREKGKLRDYGLTFGGLRWYLLTYVLMVGFHAIHVLVNLGLGLGRIVSLAEGLAHQMPGFEASTASIFLMIFIVAPLSNIIFGLGEEFGWRGYLLNKLLPSGLTFTILVSGIIWGLWHAPVVIMGHNFPEHPYLGVLIMTLTAIPMGAIFTWLRLKSGSAVVVGFAHGTINATFFLGGTFIPEASLIYTNPIGLTGLPILALITFILFKFFPPNTEIQYHRFN